MTPNPKSKLTQILDDEFCIHIRTLCDLSEGVIDCAKEQAIEKIVSLLRELVPEAEPKRDEDGGTLWNTCKDNFKRGHDACRNEMLKKLEGLA